MSSFIRSRILLIGVMTILVVIGAVWVFGPGAVQPIAQIPTLAAAPEITFTPPPDLSTLAAQFPRLAKILNNPELDSAYKEFLLAFERGGADAAILLAQQRGLLTEDNQVRITLVLDTQDSAALVTELTNLGVNVRGTYQDLIDISIPIELIVKTAQSDDPGKVFDQITQLNHVTGLQLPQVKPQNSSDLLKADESPPYYLPLASQPAGANFIDPITSEGVKFIQADVWHAAGYTGHGVKIGVLDQGFDSYRDLLGRELPITVTVKSFVPGIDLGQTGINHGAAVAEIIHDVAPDAEIFLAYYDGGDVSMGNAVDWLVSQGVQIISHSAGGMAAPMDGTGRDAEIVDRVTSAGILWINSAGNSANEHYRGAFTDTDNDGVHEYAPGKTLLGFQSTGGATTQIVLDWNDWSVTGTQALNLFLLDDQGSVLASSRNTREGGHPPVQQIIFKFDASRTYFVTIQGVNVTQPIRLDLYVHPTLNMELSDPTGSLATPGDAIGALSIGAVNWRNSVLEPFSARGPTADGRIKPDLVGPDGVSNAVNAPDRFYGTSAAAPHIAGAAALIWGAYPQASVADVRQVIISSTIDLLEPGADPLTGYGELQLPQPPPTPTPLPPTSTPAPGITITPAPTSTPIKVVIAIPTIIRSRPPINSGSSDQSGLILIGIAVITIGLAGSIGFRSINRSRTRSKSIKRSSKPDRSIQLTCTHCGRVNRATAIYCTQCGRPIGATVTATKCAQCDHVLRPRAKFCSNCGKAA
ncbi:MAG TPA: S8 family serine peptidase [Anaerolineae bacterium]|nr:S8 family serine peptidase [Anaerolineae bacterium]